MGDQEAYEQEAGKKAGGGSGLKWCLICGCLLLLVVFAVVGVFAYKVGNLMTKDPVAVAAKVQNEILPGAVIPPGYEGAFAMKVPFADVEFAVIGPQGMSQQTQAQQSAPPLLIMLCAIPPGGDADQLKRTMQQQTGAPSGQVEAEQERTITVRGQQVVVKEAVSVDQRQNVRMKQLLALVPRAVGSNDIVMIIMMGREDQFDQAAADAFFNSLR
jgi:hypothetical protein